MKRFVWGIILVVLTILGFIENKTDDANGVGVLLLIGGGTLIFFGAQYLKRLKTVTTFALQMIREDGGKIDAGLLAQRMGISEVDIRVFLAESQRKGVIPFKVDIV